MQEPILRHVTCASPRGLHRLGYTEWGPREAPVLLCVHGLTRNGRDFDALAERLSDRYRVICPDMVGRGTSDFAPDPSLYAVPQYVADCVTLVARLDAPDVTWLGTSMGGIIGMLLAALPGTPISRLILNDIGPQIVTSGLARIAASIGDDPVFESFEAGEAELRGRMTEFGPHTNAEFRYLSRHYVVQRDGRWRFHYDPKIADAVRASAGAPVPDLWPVYDAIRCPVRVIRGATSDILTAETVAGMRERGPKAGVAELPGVGHAPTLIANEQIACVERFLAD